MRIAVAFTPHDVAPADVAGRAVAVVDVLRATTTICTALHHGARAVIVAAEIDEAARLAQALDRRDVLLVGERGGKPIPGFALGNSPREMTTDVVDGKTLVMTTTNGTRALLCAGRARAFGLDDVYLAGRLLVRALDGSRSRKGMNDAAIAAIDLVRRYADRMDRALRLSDAGRELAALGFGEDVRAAAAVDAHPVLPFYHDRRVTLASTPPPLT